MQRTLESSALERSNGSETDFLPLKGTDYVEFYVGNARQAAHFYRSAFGFRLAAYRGPETGTRDVIPYRLLVQNKIRLLFTTPLRPDHPVADHIRKHGDGVRDIGLWVDDAAQAWRARPRFAAPGAMVRTRGPSTTRTARRGSRRSPSTGDTIHTFVERTNYRGVFCPATAPWNRKMSSQDPRGLQHIDHMVGNVGWGEMNCWVDFYRDVMGFRLFKHFDDKRHQHRDIRL